MNMKRVCLFLAMVSVVVIGAFAQNAPLQRGWYQTRGSSVWVAVLPNTGWNAQQQRSVPQNGYYCIQSTLEGGGQIWCVDVGPLRGNEIHTNVVFARQPYAAQEGVAMGDFEVYTILSPTSFRNSDGDVWIWRRDIQ